MNFRKTNNNHIPRITHRIYIMKTLRRITALLGALGAFSLVTLLAQEEAQPPVPAPESATISSNEVAPATPEAPAEPEKPAPPKKSKVRVRSSIKGGDELVTFFSDARVPAGKRVSEAVAIVGNVFIDGEAREAVAILGSVTANTKIDEAVSIVGSTTINGGAREAVAVIGNVSVNSHVTGQVVAVGGGVELGPDAKVDGGVVALGGGIKRDDAAVIGGKIVELKIFKNLGGFNAWITSALAKGRLLAFAPGSGWAWGVAALFLALYLFVSLVFPKQIVKCAETLELHPGYVMLAALLTAIIKPVLGIVFSVTVIGAVIFPLAVIVLAVFAKTAFFAWIGRRATLPMGMTHPLPAVLLGGVLVALLYAVPFAGLLLWWIFKFIGTGMVVYAIIVALRRRREERAALAAKRAAASPPPVENISPETAASTMPLALVQLARAGFWVRFGSLLIDFVMIWIIAGICRLGALTVPLFAAYCIVMWALRGTTIGGIVCGLRIVRLDGRPVDWSTSIVRALGGFLSILPAGLGFIWVAFDDERQSWHDKIAGTVVVRAPKGQSLI